ncbi:MAG: TonB-dependent receptor, partial [Bacteroidota bacterium]|nr:TonB-dependent receptor [Bacteroidota bacterium]
NIGFTAIPKTKRFTFNPKIFLYLNEKNSGWFGVNTTFEDRFGGDINVVKGNADNLHKYFERNKTSRISSQLSFTHEINKESKINFKNSVSFFNRRISNLSFYFKGQQTSSFSEVNYSHTRERTEWITGANVLTENFTSSQVSFLNFHQNTFGAFAQNSFKPVGWFTVETGLRIDYNNLSGNGNLKSTFVLPRINALFKINGHVTSRIGGGFGYKMSSAFSDESERLGYNNIFPFSFSNTKPERSYGANADVNYKTVLGDIRFSIDQLFFYTYLKDPFLLSGNLFSNAKGFIDTKGFETNAKFIMDDLNLFIGYTYTDTKEHFNNTSNWQTLTPKHLLNVDLAYEKENNIRTGIEMGYVSEQKLSNGSTGKGYIMFGFLFLKTFGKIDIYINAENLTDRRQTRWENIYTGTVTNPIFKEIYAPLDGAVFNGGVKIKL